MAETGDAVTQPNDNPIYSNKLRSRGTISVTQRSKASPVDGPKPVTVSHNCLPITVFTVTLWLRHSNRLRIFSAKHRLDVTASRSGQVTTNRTMT